MAFRMNIIYLVLGSLMFMNINSVQSSIPSVFSSHNELTLNPDEVCKADFDKVCMNCNSVGTCRSNGTNYVIIKTEECRPGDVCSSEFGEADCYLLAPNLSPVCSCYDTNTTCSQDFYDPSSSYVICDDPIVYGTCNASETFHVHSCSCGDSCPPCGMSFPGPDPNDCSSYYECGTGEFIGKYCPDDHCFNPANCICEFTCPSCGFAAYPDDPTKFIYCEGGVYVVQNCFEGGIYNAEVCKCVLSIDTTPQVSKTTLSEGSTSQASAASSEGPTSFASAAPSEGSTSFASAAPSEGPTFVTTETSAGPYRASTTTQSFELSSSYDPCAYCGFYAYPGDCSMFYRCEVGGGVTVEICPSQLCFNPVTCHCEN